MADEQQNKIVAFLGPVASYTHQATLNVFPSSSSSTTHHKIQPLTTIEDVFAAVQSGSATLGVVPFENSSNGSVVFTLDLFADVQNRYPDIRVCGETYLSVRHCLLGRASSSKPETGSRESGGVARATRPLHDLTGIKKLYSHPQAWGQCKGFLSTYLKGVERQDVSSTSRAAELVSHEDPSGSSSCAAIASKLAAEIHGLEILAESIEDNASNATRFLILQHSNDSLSSIPSSSNTPLPLTSTTTSPNPRDEKYKTLILFTLSHGQPGALATCLEVFSKHDLNLTSINTRPSGEAAWHYIFFVEIMGRKMEDGTGRVNEALEELGKVAKGWRWLGSWENGLVGGER